MIFLYCMKTCCNDCQLFLDNDTLRNWLDDWFEIILQFLLNLTDFCNKKTFFLSSFLSFVWFNFHLQDLPKKFVLLIKRYKIDGDCYNILLEKFIQAYQPSKNKPWIEIIHKFFGCGTIEQWARRRRRTLKNIIKNLIKYSVFSLL